MKPGYRTSEFWFTLVSFIFSGLYLTGIINDNSNKEELISVVSHAVESCILIGGQFVILYKYINSRKSAKIDSVPPKSIHDTENSTVVIDNKQEKKDEPKPTRKRKSTSSKNKPRTNTKRSRKPNK